MNDLIKRLTEQANEIMELAPNIQIQIQPYDDGRVGVGIMSLKGKNNTITLYEKKDRWDSIRDLSCFFNGVKYAIENL